MIFYVIAVAVLVSGTSLPIVFFFFNDTATTEIYTLSLHDALPISLSRCAKRFAAGPMRHPAPSTRSEEHTSELQSQFHLVCRLLLEKKKNSEGGRIGLREIERQDTKKENKK